MRRAQAQDAWRRLIETDRKFGIVRVSVVDKPPLANFQADLARGLTIVAGLNAVGKTTFLRLIFGTLAGAEAARRLLRPPLLEVGECHVQLQLDDDILEYELDANAANVAVAHLDVFRVCSRVLGLAGEPNFDDLLEGRDPHLYSVDEREQASYVLGKEYETLEVVEFEAPQIGPEEEARDDVVLPFFRASVAGVSYDCTSMGLGEFAAHVLLWEIRRLEPQTLVLLEEPETFLSSHSTLAMLDILAEEIGRRRLYVIATTHSPDVIARLPLEAIRVMQPSADGMILIAPNRAADVEHVLRAVVSQGQVVLVEDRTAKVFLRELLARFGGLWGASLEIAATGGASTLVRLCRELPELTGLHVVGVLDGDMTPPTDSEWPILALPGGDPDVDLRAAALHAVTQFAHLVGRQQQDIDTALPRLVGLDPHDWWIQLGAMIGIEPEALIRAAAILWLIPPANAEPAAHLVDEVERLLAPD